MHLEEDHLVWMLVDHPGTFLLRIQEEALGHLATQHRHNPPLAFVGLVSSSSVGPAAASHPGGPEGLNPVVHQIVAHFHLSDIDHKVERLEDSWMVEEFLMMLLVVLLVDILV